MKRGLALKFSALLLLPALWPTLILAQTPRGAGIVTTLSGQATVGRATLPQPLPLKFKDDLFLRDRISTAEKSLVRVLLGGKALVTVRELSVLTITEEVGRATLSLDRGLVGMAVARQRMLPGETIEIRTPNAIAAVRGTVLVVEVTGAETSQLTATATLTTTVSVLSGSVDVSPLDAPTTSVRVGKLERVSVTGSTVSQVSPLPPATVTQLNETLKAPIQHPDIPQEGQNQVIQNQVTTATVLANMLTGQPGAAAPTAAQDPVLQEASSPVASTVNATRTAAATTTVPTIAPTTTQAPVVSTTQPTADVKGTVTSGGALIIPPDRTINTNQTFSSASHGIGGVGGTLDGAGTVTVTGLYTWESGTMAGPGTTQANGGLAITGNVTLNRPLSNAGAGTIQGDVTIAGSGTFTNTGSLTIQNGRNLDFPNGALENLGTITIGSESTLNPGGGRTHTGTFNVPSGGTLALGIADGGTHIFNPGSAVQGAGTVALDFAGADFVGGTYNITGNTVVNGRTDFRAGVNLVSLGALSVGTNLTLNSGEPVAVPTLTIGGGTISGTDTFSVTGITTVVGSSTIALPFNNTGGVTVNTGTLRLTGGGTHSGTFQGTGNLDLSGGHTVQAGLVYRLGGTTTVSGGTLSTTGSLAQIQSGETLRLSGTMLNGNGGTLSIERSLIQTPRAGPAGMVIKGGTTPLVRLTGGTHTVASTVGTAMFDLAGDPANVTTQNITIGTAPAVTVTDQADRTLRGSGVCPACPVQASLLEASGATVGTVATPVQQGVRVDAALLEATAPLFRLLAGATLRLESDAVNLASLTRVISGAGIAFVSLDASSVTINVGALVSATGGSFLQVLGDLVRLSNLSTLTLSDQTTGFLIRASGTSVVDVSGALVDFVGTGNAVRVNNTAFSETINGVRFSFTGGANATQVEVLGTPIQGVGTIENIATPGVLTGSLIEINGTAARVRIRGN